MPGAANGMMFSAAQGSGLADPRSAETNGIDQYLDLPWAALPAVQDWTVLVMAKQLSVQYAAGWGHVIGADGGVRSAGAGLGPRSTGSRVDFRGYNGATLRADSAGSNGTIVSGQWAMVTGVQNAAGEPLVYKNASFLTSNTYSTDTPQASTIHRIALSGAATYTQLRLRFVARLPHAMSAAEVAAAYALAATNDDAAVKAYLLGLSASAGYFPVLSTTDLTGGTGALIDVCGNYSPAIPRNMTTAGCLSTDVP